MSDFFEMFTFIAYLFIGSVYTFGVFKLFDDILLPVRSWVEEKIGVKWAKPLLLCPPCMASFHGFYIGLYLFGLSWWIPVYCLCLCGLNHIVNNLLFEYD